MVNEGENPKMLNVTKLLPQARGLASALVRRAPTVDLDWDTRQKSRFETTDSQGRRLGVFLPRGSVARGGDVLVADDGSLLRVVALAQPVLVVRHCPQHGSPFDLLRAAYHLGNRHVPLELHPDRLQLEADHVLAEMLRGMHLIVTEEQAAFEPEAGAYGSAGHAGGHGHDHGPRDDPGHGHPHEHGPGDGPGHMHEHEPAEPTAPRGRPIGIAVKPAAAPHVHGPDCGHDHHEH